MMRFKQLALATVCASALTSGAAIAQTWMANAPGERDLELMQIFRVETDGPRARMVGQQGDPGRISEVGTAFAIAPGALMTAKHVPHEAREFRNTSRSSVVWIPDRLVEISYAEERRADPDTDETQRVTITPSPFPTIDASRINLGELEAEPFPLSACPIRRGGEYYLVKLRNGDLGFPVVVPITADTNEHSGAGDLRLFTHNLRDDNDDLPRSGDSGSPILDAEGQVVGLLTAILEGSDKLYVTLTRNWLDLVPPGVQVACDTSVTKRDLNALQGTMTAYTDQQIAPMQRGVAMLTGLTANLGATDESIRSDLQALENELTAYIDEQVGPLKQEAKRLAELTESLVAADESIEEDIARMVLDIEDIRLRTSATVQALFAEVEDDPKEDLFIEFYNELKVTDPVIPGVQRANEGVDLVKGDVVRMLTELSEADWSFSFNDNQIENDTHILTVQYSRDISAPLFAERLEFCAKAMLPPPEGTDIDYLPRSEDHTQRSYYRVAEEKWNGIEQGCQFNLHATVGRGGQYRFTLSVNDPLFENFEDWNGMFYAVIFEKEKHPEILHRMVFVTDPDDLSATPDCYYYGYEQGVHDDIASFARATTDQKLRGIEAIADFAQSSGDSSLSKVETCPS